MQAGAEGRIRRSPKDKGETPQQCSLRLLEEIDTNANRGPDKGMWYASHYESCARATGTVEGCPESMLAESWEMDRTWQQGYTVAPGLQQNDAYAWTLQEGQSASAAIDGFLQGLTIAECATAIRAVQYAAVRRSIGAKKFDRQFGSTDGRPKDPAMRMVISMAKTPVNPLVEYGYLLPATTDIAQAEASVDELLEGLDEFNTDPQPGRDDAYIADIGNRVVTTGSYNYFRNHPLYTLKHPTGAWQGENVQCLDDTPGAQKWRGFGLEEDMSETQVLQELLNAYNEPGPSRLVKPLCEAGQVDTYPKHDCIPERIDSVQQLLRAPVPYLMGVDPLPAGLAHEGAVAELNPKALPNKVKEP